MTINEIKAKVASSEYDFLKTGEHLGNNIILLGLGGSHAYGMDTPTSDLDIRGVAVNSKHEILTGHNFEQFVNEATDTTVYSFNKIVSLLINCNPNTCEILGLKPEHYIYLHPIGQELIDNKELFLSKRAINSFGGYANQQLRRLENKSVREVEQSRREQHILNTIEHASHDFKRDFFQMPDGSIKLYIDKAIQEDYDTEIFMDVHLSHYPLRDYASMWNTMQGIVKSYAKIGKRNSRAIDHNKLGKHMAHLLRLFMMCIDILELGEIITFREAEHKLLMDVRSNKFLDENGQPTPEFYALLEYYERRLAEAIKKTKLPENPDYDKIYKFVASVNERIVRGEFYNEFTRFNFY